MNINFIEDYFKSIDSKYELILRPAEVMNCLTLFSDLQSDIKYIVVYNQNNINNYIVHDKNQSYYYLGFDKTGNIVTKGILNKNIASGLDITVLIDSYIILFKNKELFEQYPGNIGN